MLENLSCEKSSFVSLTYSEETVPCIRGFTSIEMTLVPRDVQMWLKRLRKAVAPERLRFFAVGEYGTERERPHYHVAVFGYEGCWYGDSRLSPDELCRCPSCVLLRGTWPKGFVHQGTIELKSMQYLCSYMLKGMYRRDDVRLRGREPEFRRMSLRPGIGAYAMSVVSEDVNRFGLVRNRVVPAALRIGGRILPIGKYLRGRLRQELGLGDVATVEEVEVAKERMQSMYALAQAFTDQSVAYGAERVSDKVLYAVLVEANREKARQLEVREKIWKGKGK